MRLVNGRYHPERREGNGSLASPVSRKGHLCAVEDCPEMAGQMRVTNSGFSVLYCRRHDAMANKLFDGD